MSIRGDEQIIGFQILCQKSETVVREGEQKKRYPMENPIPMTKLESAKCHRHPAFDVRWEEHKRTVFDDHFQVRVEELEDEIEICFRREDIDEL